MASFVVVGLVLHFIWTVLPEVYQHTPALPIPTAATAMNAELTRNEMDGWHRTFYMPAWNHINTMLIAIATAYMCTLIRQR